MVQRKNSKTMNTNKKTIVSDGWILCPSKTFPGKLYYFNVLNGEAAWSLGDAEKKIIKNPITKEQENHHHPEPTNPPTEPLFPLSRHPTHVFGQPGFKVHPKPANLIWTPIQIQVPIVVPEKRVDQKPGLKSPVKMIWEFNQDLFSHATGKPLFYRFVNYEKPVIHFDKQNKIQKVLQFNKFTELNNLCTESRKHEENLKAKTNASYTEIPIGSDLRPRKQLIKETVFNIDIPSETAQEQIEPDAGCNRDHVLNVEDEKVCGNSNGQNLEGDLRNLLLAKKLKSLDVRMISEEESKKHRILGNESTPKKRVSFNLDDDTSSLDDDEMYFREKCSITIEVLRDLAGTVLMEWYLVVDADVLLDEFSFLDSFVQIDPQCKLIIPSSAMSYVRAASRGAHAATARSILRRLDAPYIIVQSEDVAGATSPNDAILKSCIESVNRLKHVILITTDLGLLATAKRYPIHCYHINSIKNGLAPKPQEHKQNMRITIRNTEANPTVNGPAENMLVDDLNKEKEVLKCSKQNKVNLIPKESSTPNNISNFRISIDNSTFSCNKSSFHQFSRITRQNETKQETSENATNTNKNLSINSQKETMNLRENSQTRNSMNSQTNPINSQDSNINTISLNHLFYITKEVFNSIAKNKENISNEKTDGNKKSFTEWRYTASDATETTIEMDMHNLNIKEKNHKINKNTNQTEILNKTPHFQTSTPKNDNQIFKNRTFVCRNVGQGSNLKTPVFQDNGNIEQGSNFEIQKSNNTPMLQKRGSEQDSNCHIQKSNIKTSIFQNCGNQRDSNFEIPKSISKEPQIENGTESIFEIDVFKKPNEPLIKSVDLSNFYVKSKVMDNRLKERMEEFLCSYKQIMEEFLTSILEKLSTSVLKCPPPWSLYEALQCAKNVYKDHITVKNIVDQMMGYLYEANCGIDKMKMYITPNEFMKALGCAIHLIKYLKKILPATDMLDSEEQLMDMLKQVENPMTDIIEPLVKTPIVNTDLKEVRRNFSKNPTDVISYLKKHYPEWQRYDANDNTMKIVRTFGRKDVATKNTDVASGSKDVGNATNSKVSLECTKLPAVGDAPTKNDSIFVMKEVDCNTRNGKSEQRVKVVQENRTNIRKHIDDTDETKNIENIKKTKPKTRSIFDFVIPKDSKNLENREKFNNCEILGVKITVPNDNPRKESGEKNDNRLDMNESFNKVNNKCVRKLNMNTNDKNQEIKQINVNVSKTDNKEKGIKIVRNIYLIEEFEKRLKNKQNLDLDDLDYIIISDTDDNDETNCSHSDKSNSDENYDHLNVDHETNKASSCINDPTNDGSDPKSDSNDKSDSIARKRDKDDMTNDSGIGNESPRVYSVVKSFSSELENSLERIRTYIDGSLQEFSEGKISDETKKRFRLKAFETNFLITKIIGRLKKIAQKDFDSNEKISKNAEAAVTKCLEQAVILQNSCTMILSVTNENVVDINSSMSLNLSS